MKDIRPATGMVEFSRLNTLVEERHEPREVNMSEEIQPYVVYRIEGGQMEPALWQFKQGPMALSLFLSGDSATSYRESANLGGEWMIFRPAKEALLQMLKCCNEAGIDYAVLDPDLEQAKQIFNIQEILNAVRE